MLGSSKEIPVDMRNGQGEPNKDFVVTLLIMDEDGTIHPITAFKKNLEIPVDIKFNPGGSEKENDILEKVSFIIFFLCGMLKNRLTAPDTAS